METHTSRSRIATYWRRFPVSWVTVSVLAVVIAYANGFMLTSLQGTIGAVERLESPFHRWLRDSTITVPIYLLAIVAALALTRRIVGQRRGGARFMVSVLLVVGATVSVAMTETATSSAYDYYLQTVHINDAEHLRHPTYVIKSGTPVLVGNARCDASCQALKATKAVHLRALRTAVVLFLVTNTVLVLWLLALCGGRLWVTKRPTAAATIMISEPVGMPAMGEALA